MLDKFEFNRRIEKFLNKPFILEDSEEGCNCISLLLNVYKDWYTFPDEFEGVTLKNRAAKWRKEPRKTKAIMGRFLQSLGVPVAKNFQRKGDILLFKGTEIPVFYAIDLGNCNMAMLFTEGFYIVPFQSFRDFFIGARRLVE